MRLHWLLTSQVFVAQLLFLPLENQMNFIICKYIYPARGVDNIKYTLKPINFYGKQ